MVSKDTRAQVSLIICKEETKSEPAASTMQSMIKQQLWKRLEAIQSHTELPSPLPIVSCGWNPRDPRRPEYQAYVDAWKPGTPDPAFTLEESSGLWTFYRFDHTKVPEGWEPQCHQEPSGAAKG